MEKIDVHRVSEAVALGGRIVEQPAGVSVNAVQFNAFAAFAQDDDPPHDASLADQLDLGLMRVSGRQMLRGGVRGSRLLDRHRQAGERRSPVSQ